MAGSVPSSATEPSWGEPPEPSQWGPTDDELLAAMDAFEKQCEAEAAEAAAAADTAMDTMEGEPEDRPLSESESLRSHGRRRLHAAVYDRHGHFHHPGEP